MNPADESDKFKKQPRRKADKGRRVTATPEQRAAYEEALKLREKQAEANRHLPDRPPR